MGHAVGFIDAGGCCWESCEERDLAVTAGVYVDAWREWNRGGGSLGPEPRARAIAMATCLDWGNVEKAAEEARAALRLVTGAPARRSLDLWLN
jgi:hypothetical protein